VHSQDSCESQLSSAMRALSRDQGEDVRQTLERIQGTSRRLLALRSYVRSREALTERWSWSQSQIDAYRHSREYQDLVDEVKRIRARFEADNPGFELYGNTEVRSLDVQIQRWNENQGVARVAASLEKTLCQHAQVFSASELRELLHKWQPHAPSPLAAPGLSLHGRARAIDFQVHQGTRVVAGPEVAKIASTWEAQGWSAKLSAAVSAVSDKFEGPLKMPNEPWHYEYRPNSSQ
jgi:hypothetical protein